MNNFKGYGQLLSLVSSIDGAEHLPCSTLTHFLIDEALTSMTLTDKLQNHNTDLKEMMTLTV